MSEEEQSRVYTINLSKVWLSPRIRRTKRAINMIREFAQRHMKSKDVKIDQSLNEVMWERGIRHPPRRIRVRMVKDEDDIVTVSLYSEQVKEEEKIEEEPKAEGVVPTTVAPEPVIGDVTKEEEITPTESEKIEESKMEKQEESLKKDEEMEPEKMELSDKELAEILTKETEGLEIKEEETEDAKANKSGEESKE